MIEPDLSLYVEDLAAQPIGVGLFLAGAGVVFMILGHRIFRVLIGLSFGAVGYLFGSQLAPNLLGQILFGLAGGFALATIAMYFLRGAVAILTGTWCAVIVWGLVSPLSLSFVVVLGLAVIAFAIAISLTFIMYDEIIAFVTSLEGSFLCLAALVILFSRSPVLWAHIRQLLVGNPLFVPFVILTGTVTGFYFQLADLRHKHTGAGL